ncbi:MAG: response regulator transcription factor [Saprospiraceae bacterium]|nr:response regulator transcription factor [Saprospiraceae bacterium]
MPLNIIIYEDNIHLGSSLRTLFDWNQEYKVLAVLTNPGSILTDLAVLKPDILLMDIDMPIMTGVEAIKLIRKNNIQIPVIMLTVFEDDENIIKAIQSGANGYLLKKNVDRIIPAIQDVLSGGAPMSGYVARRVLELFAQRKNSNDTNTDFDLTVREKEILDLLVKGYSYKMMAGELDIAIDTIRNHIKKIYRKLEVNSATEAVYKYTKG